MTWIIIALVVVLAGWFIASQRNLVKFDELCGNAMSQIGVQLASRWDAVTALAQLTKGYNEHEYETFTETTRQRASIGTKSTAEDAQKQEDLISGALSRLLAVAENYPELKANEVYLSTMDKLSQYEENVRTSRMVYNDAVTKYNRYVRQIPANIIASALGFAARDYLEADDDKAAMPSVQ